MYDWTQHEWIDPQCAGHWDLFFPPVEKPQRKGSKRRQPAESPGQRAERIAAAKELCKGCPDALPCLEMGLLMEVDSPRTTAEAAGGIWGGMTRQELLAVAHNRRKARKPRRRKEAG